MPRRHFISMIPAALAAAVAAALALALTGCGLVSTPAPPAGSASAGFPRTGILWPDGVTQPIEQIARYDLVVLGEWQYDLLPQVKLYHRSATVLASCNASSRSLDNLEGVPNDWMLTQAGSELSNEVGAEATSLPLKATRAGVRPLFEAGDLVVIGQELATVTAVGGGGLVVERGAHRPATAHPAGTRVAATITFWPNSVIMDASTSCPKVVVDPRFGPEDWGAFNARTSAADVLENPLFAGTFLDSSDAPMSWLVTRGYARDIDPSRTNAPVADRYRAFDAAWVTGLRASEQRLRDLVGNRIVLGNNAWPNKDLLNGTVFETFPSDGGGWNDRAWREVMFGPPDATSVSNWVAHARRPNMTTVLTYEDDGTPDANPAQKPGFVPDYRKMRYGLATALVGGTYFAYEIATNGQGALGLFWFDEYEGAGRGRGWMGKPSAPASETAPGVWRRDYEAGTALVNTTRKPATVGLGGTFHRLTGEQDPAVNDGSTVTTVTLPALDGLVLARRAAAKGP